MHHSPSLSGRRGWLLPWIVGILLATLLFAVLSATLDLRYYGSDDTPILRSFMGYEGGVPAQFHLYLHTAFAWLLHGLALLFPGVSWFSILQLFLLWFSCAVIGKSLAAGRPSPPPLAGKTKRGLTLLPPLAAAAIFLLVFGAYVLCRISYTTTASLLGAAAVAQLLSVDVHACPGRILRGMGLSIALLLCCYCLRQISVLPPLAFWALGLGGKLLSRGRIKALLHGALLCALCFAVFAGIRAAEISLRGAQDFLAWHRARIQAFDYTHFGPDQSADTLEKLGWSPAEMLLLTNWFFMDANISTEAFQTLYEAQPEASHTFGDRAAGIPGALAEFGAREPAYVLACWALLALWLFVLLAPAREAVPDHPAACRGKLPALLALPLGAALMGYLAYQGRMPLRAVASVLFPLGTFLCMGLPGLSSRTRFPVVGSAISNPETGVGSRVPALLALLACLVLCGLSVGATAQRVFAPMDPEAEAWLDIPGQLDAYALENPDVIIIHDMTLVLDRRLFPDTAEGIPGNILFWGGWPARSPSWLYQLAQYGIDGNTFTAHDFLRDNLVLASTDGEPCLSLVSYVSEIVGPVDWEVYSMYGYINTFQLYEVEPWEDFEDAADLAGISFLHS